MNPQLQPQPKNTKPMNLKSKLPIGLAAALLIAGGAIQYHNYNLPRSRALRMAKRFPPPPLPKAQKPKFRLERYGLASSTKTTNWLVKLSYSTCNSGCETGFVFRIAGTTLSGTNRVPYTNTVLLPWTAYTASWTTNGTNYLEYTLSNQPLAQATIQVTGISSNGVTSVGTVQEHVAYSVYTLNLQFLTSSNTSASSPAWYVTSALPVYVYTNSLPGKNSEQRALVTGYRTNATSACTVYVLTNTGVGTPFVTNATKTCSVTNGAGVKRVAARLVWNRQTYYRDVAN